MSQDTIDDVRFKTFRDCRVVSGGRVDRETCWAQSVLPQHRTTTCARCRCPFRICWKCALQSSNGTLKIPVSNRFLGICAFHERDPKAIRSSVVERPSPAPHVADKPGPVGQLFRAAINRIRPFDLQPREFFDEAALAQLAENIQERGQLVPVIVRALKDDPECDWELVDGQRRWYACTDAGLETLVCIEQKVHNQEEQFELSLIGNLHREDLQPLEKARAIKRLMEGSIKYTQTQIAKMVGLHQPQIGPYLSLLELEPETLKLLDPALPRRQQLTLSVAFELVDLLPKDQIAWAQRSIKENISARRIRTMVARIQQDTPEANKRPRRKRGPDDDYRLLQSFLHRTHNDSLHFSDLDIDGLKRLFEHRKSEDLRAAKATLQLIKAALDKIDQRLIQCGRGIGRSCT